MGLPAAVELGTLAIGATLGGMLFFSACVAPLAALRLAPDVAGRFMRALVHAHHAYGLCGTALAAFFCAGAAPAAAALSFAAFLCFLVARQVLLPATETARDAAMADAGTARRFQRLRRAGRATGALQVALLLAAFLSVTTSG